MSAMAAPSGGGRSILNPNAPLFIPAALQQVEDFSPEWWELVKTTPWFRDHWFRQHQDQENFDGEEEEDDKELEEYGAFGDATQEQYGLVLDAVNDKVKFGLETDAEALMKRLSLKSPKNGVSTKTLVEPAKYKEKPAQKDDAHMTWLSVLTGGTMLVSWIERQSIGQGRFKPCFL
ncbi:hypothetical protein HPP92_012113 [Vanilla planifolia]|uniref:Uncharacterized protein n=1 Tax=Vanilla planifolia TaxID=51239 RepID=A0A835V1N2_VANPL|nr:hypothetical protein HPP92_012113 [Vanilla planifolia]